MRHPSLLLLLLVLASCGAEPAADRGKALFSDPSFSPSPSNPFSCATCHAVTPQASPMTPDPYGRRLPGYTLYGSPYRPSYWGGGYNYMLDAVNRCYIDFMRGTTLSADDVSGRAVLTYLQLLTPSMMPDKALPLTLVRNIDSGYLSSLPAGDAQKGTTLYQMACMYCHGELHTGNGRLSSHVSIVPDDTLSTFGAAMAKAVIAEKMRHGRYFGISGNMPFFSLEALSDGELSDILSYVLP